jgi:hypothetical protein
MRKMENFEQKMSETLQRAILKGISEMRFLDYNHSNKLGIPADLVKNAFDAIDRDKIFNMVKEQIEEQIAKTIVGQLLTETSNDTKRIMSNPVLRRQIKDQIYPQIMKMDGGE